MHIVFSINGVPIRLTDERWLKHILLRHPELENNLNLVLKTIASPELIQQGDVGTLMAIRQIQDKYLVVIYKELHPNDGFVVSAYFTKKLRRRLIVWKP